MQCSDYTRKFDKRDVVNRKHARRYYQHNYYAFLSSVVYIWSDANVLRWVWHAPVQSVGQECCCIQISVERLLFRCSCCCWSWQCWQWRHWWCLWSLWWRYWCLYCCWHWRQECSARPPLCRPDASPLNHDRPAATLDASWDRQRIRIGKFQLLKLLRSLRHWSNF